MTKKTFKEHESIRITQPTKTAFVGGRDENLILPAGSEGAVIYVWGDPHNPAFYQVEVYLKETDEFAVANVPAEFVEAR